MDRTILPSSNIVDVRERVGELRPGVTDLPAGHAECDSCVTPIKEVVDIQLKLFELLHHRIEDVFDDWGEAVMAVVVPHDTDAVTADDIRSFADERRADNKPTGRRESGRSGNASFSDRDRNSRTSTRR